MIIKSPNSANKKRLFIIHFGLYLFFIILLTPGLQAQRIGSNFENTTIGVVSNNEEYWDANSINYPQWVVDKGVNQNIIIMTGALNDHTLGTSNGKYIFFNPYFASNGTINYLTSKELSFRAGAIVYMKFWYHMYGSMIGTFSIEQQVNNIWVTTSWIKSGQQQSSRTAPWINDSVVINPAATAVRIKGVNSGFWGNASFDDISIIADKDLAVVDWLKPSSSQQNSNSISFGVRIQNQGINNTDTIILRYSIDNGQTYSSDTLINNLSFLDTLSHTFSTLANMSQSGLYHCLIVVGNTDDKCGSNDTLRKDIFVGSPLSGIYTIGTDTSNDFSNISIAIATVEQMGVSGAVQFLLDSGQFIVHQIIDSIPGISANRTLTIKGKGENSVLIPQSNINDPTVIELRGINHLIIDSLKIWNASNASIFNAIRFTNSADSNVVKQCIIDCGSQVGGSINGILASSTPLVAMPGNNANYNIIEGNHFYGGEYAINFMGTSLNNLCNFNVFSKNTFYNQTQAAINNRYQNSPSIEKNKIYSGMNTVATADAIYLHDCNGAISISKNYINYLEGQSGIRLFSVNIAGINSSLYAYVTNNEIHMHKIIAGECYGLFSLNAKVHVYYNSINITGTNNTTSCINSKSSTTMYAMNNILSNKADGYAIDLQGGDINDYYNLLYTSGVNFCNDGGNYSNLYLWYNHNFTGAGSDTVNPNFYSNSDLRVSNTAYDNMGTPISSILDDINGKPRDNTNPDVGAYETSPVLVDLTPIVILEPVNGQPDTAKTIKVRIANNGLQAVDSFLVKFSIDNGNTYISELCTDTIASGSLLDFTFSATVNMGINQGYSCVVVTESIEDSLNLNDSLFHIVYELNPLAGHYTIGLNSTDSFHSINAAVNIMNIAGISDSVIFHLDSVNFNEFVSIQEVNGANDTNLIIFKGYGLKTQIYNSNSNSGHRFVFNFQHAKHVIIDSVSIINQNNASYFWGIHFMNESDSISIRNCNIDCGTLVSQDLIGILASANLISKEAEGYNAHHITIENNTIQGGYWGIAFIGKNNQYLPGIKLLKNHLTNQSDKGIYLYYNKNYLIESNIIQTGASATWQQMLIYANWCSGVSTISKNKLFSNLGLYGLAIHNSNDTISLINNMISTKDIPAMYIYTNHINLFYNSIYIRSDGSYNSYAVHLKANNSSIYNNIFMNATGGSVFEMGYNNGSFTNDYNNYYHDSNYLAISGSGGAPSATLSAWKSSTGMAQNSTILNPGYTSANDLHITSLNMLGTGTPLIGIIDDIDGDSRIVSTPEMGADEYGNININLGPDISLCPGDSILLTTNLSTLSNILWKHNGNILSTNDSIYVLDSGLYVVQVNFGTMLGTDSIIIKHYSQQQLNINGNQTPYCMQDAVDTLLGQPAGGQFSGSTNPFFVVNPQLLGAGSHNIKYIYTDSNGCVTNISDSIQIIINPLVFLLPDTSFKWVYGSILLDAGNPGAQYLWSNGAITQTQLFDSSNLIAGQTNSIYVIVTDSGCSGIDTININPINDVSVRNPIKFQRIETNPNPAHNQLQVKFSSINKGGTLQIFNNEGRVVVVENIWDTEKVRVLNINQLAKGMYFIRYQTESSIWVGKFVKE